MEVLMQYQTLNESGFLRIKQILGDKNETPPIQPIFPVSKSHWWEGVKAGRYPKPVKLGPRTTAWRISDIKKLLDSIGEDQP
jgi:prophage regulatory protein